MFSLFNKKKKFNNNNLPKRMWQSEDLTEKEEKYYKNVFDQITGAEFIDILNTTFTPYVKSLGFKGSKNNFYRRIPPVIQTINIFKDKWGGNCTLNVGIHLDFIENHLNELPIPSKFVVEDCIINENISLNNDNSWFFYGKTIEEGNETAQIMIDTFTEKGIPFLNKFENYPHPFDKITFEDIVTPTDKYANYGINKGMLEYPYFHIFLAKFNYNFGNPALALKILTKARNDVHSDERFIRLGVSPLLKTIDETIKLIDPPNIL